MSDAVTQAYENLAHTLVKPLLGDAKYEVKTRIKDGKLEILVDAEPSARGRLIGRGGKIARSLRTIVQAAAIETDLQVSFDIVD